MRESDSIDLIELSTRAKLGGESAAESAEPMQQDEAIHVLTDIADAAVVMLDGWSRMCEALRRVARI